MCLSRHNSFFQTSSAISLVTQLKLQQPLREDSLSTPLTELYGTMSFKEHRCAKGRMSFNSSSLYGSDFLRSRQNSLSVIRCSPTCSGRMCVSPTLGRSNMESKMSLGTGMHAFNLNTQEIEAEVDNSCWFEANLGCYSEHQASQCYTVKTLSQER